MNYWTLRRCLKLQDKEEPVSEEPKDENESLSVDQPIQEEPQEVELMHEFNFVAFNQDITILGAKGSGKSYLATHFLQNFHGMTCFVWDMNHQFSDSRSMVFHNLDDMIEAVKEAKNHPIKCILQDFNKDESQFRKFCRFVFNYGNCICFLDELHSYVGKNKMMKEFNDLILSGRPRGISMICISSRPASIPNNVLSNTSHVFAFRLNLESDTEFLESYVGTEVWQLMNQDKRKKMKELPELEKHSFYYRNMDETSGVIGKI